MTPQHVWPVVLAAAIVAGALASADASQARTSSTDHAARPVAGCHVFPKNNYWHADISKLPQNRRSDAWIRHMSPRSNLHPDFGRAYGAQPVPYGIPITVVGASHRKVSVNF